MEIRSAEMFSIGTKQWWFNCGFFCDSQGEEDGDVSDSRKERKGLLAEKEEREKERAS